MKQRYSETRRLFDQASKESNRQAGFGPLTALRNGITRLKDQLAKLTPSSLVSPLATYSILAFMTLSVAVGGAGSASALSSQELAAMGTGIPAAVQINTGDLHRAPADSYLNSVLQTPVAEPNTTTNDNGAVAPVQPVAPVEQQPVAAPTNANEMQTKFIMSAVGPAQESQRATGVPASVTIAQAALESDWGRSSLSTEGQNYFGIKATSGPGTAGVVNMPTGEYIGGSYVVVNAPFKAYNNMADSFTDHGMFLKNNTRYANLFTFSDSKEFARGLQSAGYATDPAYASKLIKSMDTYNLYQYNVS